MDVLVLRSQIILNVFELSDVNFLLHVLLKCESGEYAIYLLIEGIFIL
jgi:hypothetical protein